MLQPTLVEFLLRLAFGSAVAMTITSSKLVVSGFFRIHLWMLLGFFTLTAMVVFTHKEPYVNGDALFWLSVTAAVVSYVASVLWLYEQHLAGKIALVLLGLGALVGSLLATGGPVVEGESLSVAAGVVAAADAATGGLLLGATLMSMLLGHWYLNSPTMELDPLWRLLGMLAVAIGLRFLMAGVGLALGAGSLGETQWMFVALRVLAGLVGPAVLAVLVWQTLKVPNTQSATGILYAALALVFIGELTSQLLSVQTPYPI